MKITLFDIFKYNLPLAKSYMAKHHKISIRSGLVLHLKNGQNHSGWGEISPLPGLHQENRDQALQQLLTIKPLLLGQEIPENLLSLSRGFETLIGKYNPMPSVRFGIETALLNLLAVKKHRSLCALLSSTYPKHISLHALLQGTKTEVQTKARELVAQGFKAFKLKVGSADKVAEDVEKVEVVRSSIGQEALLYLDANRAWRWEQALAFAKGIVDYNISYLEEPLRDYAQVSNFFKKTGIPIALDETLASMPLPSSLFPAGVKVLVLKPSVLGGFEKAMHYVRRAREYGIIPVVSSAFETGIGLSALANFAASLNQPDTTVGLGTYHWFQEDLLLQRFHPLNGQIDVEAVFMQSQHLQMEQLKKHD